MSDANEWDVPETLAGVRLDKALAEMLPDASLRHRRRLCDDGAILVDGRQRRPGYKVRTGQRIELSDLDFERAVEAPDLRIVHRMDDYAAVFKPGGVHSATIVGRASLSVEAMLPELFPDCQPTLLNRLDFLTSGLTLVALHSQAVGAYRALERVGTINKFYTAVVEGRFDGTATVKKRLDTANRTTTRVLSENDPDSRRWTTVEARSHDRERDTTRVRCLIVKGGRHQIRAHLAGLGHPILGDSLYGAGTDGEPLRLHHGRIEFEGFAAEIEAPF